MSGLMKFFDRLLDRDESPRDAGSVAMFTAIFAIAAFALAGLLIDGGLAINERQRIYGIAESAARAGADNIDVPYLRETGKVRIQAAGACNRVRDIVAQYDGEVELAQCDATNEQVTVTLNKDVRTTLLSIVGVNDFELTATMSAHPQDGV
jgi:Flp pilus assembly protein TadG